MSRDYDFWIYIMTNELDSVLYIGMTNDLSLKRWSRKKKVDLMARINPRWFDLFDEISGNI